MPQFNDAYARLQAANALTGGSFGKVWASLLGSRSAGVTYTNTSGKDRDVYVSSQGTGTPQTLIATVGGVEVAFSVNSTASYQRGIYFTVPAGEGYVVTGAGTIFAWAER